MTLITKKYLINTIPTQASDANVWIEWHKSAKAFFSKKVANSLWVTAWADRGSKGANTTDLRDYMKSQGVEVETDKLGKLIDFGGDVFDFFGDIFTIGKWTAIVIIVLILGGTSMLLFNILKSPMKSAKTAGTIIATKGMLK